MLYSISMSIKKINICLFLLFIFISSNIFSVDAFRKPLINPFPSQENLEKFEKTDNIDLYDKEELDAIKISLITTTPGEPIYSWFGHSAIMVEQKDKEPIIYDYGIFNFDSENFYENFLLGKMYYLLLPSYANTRFLQPIEENRAITKVELNISDNKKLDIINFLQFNSQEQNRTYLYDFYIDNCATRIRDIFNWIDDNNFQEWASNQYTPFTYRNLSTKELDNSYFVNWVLNAFLGPSCDENITAWETMFLPEYLEKILIDYTNIDTTQSIINKNTMTSTFSSFPKHKHHLLFYSLIGLILGLIGLFLKTLKQDHELKIYGIYNSILILFLFIISLFIYFFVFHSNIQAAWNNENIYFLNPIIYFMMLVLSLRTLSKSKNSVHKLIVYEKFCTIYSTYLVLFIILKNIIPDTLYQQNYTIIIPIFIFFSVENLLFRTNN